MGTKRRNTPRARLSGSLENGAADPFLILINSAQSNGPRRVLKHGDIFGVFDHLGDIHAPGMGETGLYFQGTRFLAQMLLALGSERPLFLSSIVHNENALFTVDLMNPELSSGSMALTQGTIHVERNKLLWQCECFERLRLRNYGNEPVRLPVNYHFSADFADLFEVRGTPRRARGEMLSPLIGEHQVALRYQGLDDVLRETRISFSLRPHELTASRASFDIELAPRQELVLGVTVSCVVPHETPHRLAFDDALVLLGHEIQNLRKRSCEIHTNNIEFDDWVGRSLTDLDMMVSETPHGPYPFAGVPWFSTPFGRDGIITALECLWFNPTIARGVLQYLAATQATAINVEQDAQPGKILHETRQGEMAALGEIPFGTYYGSVDSTPLYLMLASAYYERTADLATIESIWPHLERALAWIDDYGDLDGDGFVEYARQSSNGLDQQGWKDSRDSVFHADGSLAPAPIALCEVQGYTYAAWLGSARLAGALGKSELAAQLMARAEQLQANFERMFWCDELSTYALALDGLKRPCRVVSSNAGQCLTTGIATPAHAARVAATLMSDDCFTGWGVRTVATSAARYNPMSYHNGSIWPHDNALIAYGLDRYAHKQAACRILNGMFEASKWIDLRRMPELFCGFPLEMGKGPTLYPVACAPQAWAAGSVFLLLQASLGMHIRAPAGEIRFSYPVLPESIPQVQLSNLVVGSASVDLLLQRHGDDVGVNVLRRTGNIEVVAVK